jgi:hypothetical protein
MMGVPHNEARRIRKWNRSVLRRLPGYVGSVLRQCDDESWVITVWVVDETYLDQQVQSLHGVPLIFEVIGSVVPRSRDKTVSIDV